MTLMTEHQNDDKNLLLTHMEKHLSDAAKSLFLAWKLAKHNGMEPTAKELADTVLDVQTACQQVKDAIELEKTK